MRPRVTAIWRYACTRRRPQVHALYVQGEWVTRQCFPRRRQGNIWTARPARGLERRTR